MQSDQVFIWLLYTSLLATVLKMNVCGGTRSGSLSINTQIPQYRTYIHKNRGIYSTQYYYTSTRFLMSCSDTLVMVSWSGAVADRATENLGSGLSASLPFKAAFGVSLLTYIKRQGLEHVLLYSFILLAKQTSFNLNTANKQTGHDSLIYTLYSTHKITQVKHILIAQLDQYTSTLITHCSSRPLLVSRGSRSGSQSDGFSLQYEASQRMSPLTTSYNTKK